jgi:hypothetical protein
MRTSRTYIFYKYVYTCVIKILSLQSHVECRFYNSSVLPILDRVFVHRNIICEEHQLKLRYNQVQGKQCVNMVRYKAFYFHVFLHPARKRNLLGSNTIWQKRLCIKQKQVHKSEQIHAEREGKYFTLTCTACIRMMDRRWTLLGKPLSSVEQSKLAFFCLF